MDQDTSRTSDLPGPLRAVASGLRHLPGAEQLGRVAGGTLDAIGAVSPRGRRMAVYAGAGVLGVAGVVEWPVALTGAAVAWLTRPRPTDRPDGGPRTPSRGAADDRPATSGATRTPGGREAAAAPAGPGDRLTLSRHRDGREERAVHEQPAKVGDTATAEGLKHVAEATSHHGSPAPAQPRHDRPAR